MFKEDDPLLSRPPAMPLDGGTVGGQSRMDGGFHMRADSMTDEQGLGFHVPPYPSTYSPPCSTVSFQEEFCPKASLEEHSTAMSERHPSFENLELGFTELLPPLYPRGPQPPSPSPWLDSPYLSSSPSPSHSSSLSPFPAGSPISTSPYPQYSAYPPEMCPSPPANQSTYQDICSASFSHYEGWDPQGRVLGMGHGGETDAKSQECPLEFSSSASMQHITFEEGELHVTR